MTLKPNSVVALHHWSWIQKTPSVWLPRRLIPLIPLLVFLCVPLFACVPLSFLSCQPTLCTTTTGADVVLQREVAERLANEAVKADRQQQIVELGGLKLLLPLTKSEDNEVQRLAAHALANLSVSTDNQIKLARQGGVEMLITLLPNKNVHVQR